MNANPKKIIFSALLFTSIFSPLHSNAGANTYGVGVEGFQDTYKEPGLNLTDKTNYGSLTGYYSHQSGRTFISFDGRGSYGKDDYNSPSGHLSGVPQWEFELRARLGMTMPLWGGSLSPYVGVGARYFRDEGKGQVTDLGALAYDRRILQAYIPIGTSLSFVTEDGWSITPQIEADISPYGDVDSRLTNVGPVFIPGVGVGEFKDPAYNKQSFGYGGRGEIMFGKAMNGYSWQVGPFIRYWHFNESDTVTYTDTATGAPAVYVVEPENNRTQVGITARILW